MSVETRIFILNMPKTKEQKQEILDQLASHLDKQTAVAFVDFKGLSVKEINALRAGLREQREAQYRWRNAQAGFGTH